MTAPTQITARELIAAYDALLIDAYGVLVDARAALPGAAELIAAATEAKRRIVVVTNDASRLPGTIAARFARFGKFSVRFAGFRRSRTARRTTRQSGR